MGLHQNLVSEPVSRMVLREAIKVLPCCTVREVVAMMRAKDLGCAIVVDRAGWIVGTFTESDLTQLLSRGAAQLDEPVEFHLSPRWAAVRSTDPIAVLLALMHSRNLRFVCVTDNLDRPIALSGQRGLMEHIADHFPRKVLVERIGTDPAFHYREGA